MNIYEECARRLCKAKGEDPDALGDNNVRWWQIYAAEFRDLHFRMTLLRGAVNRQREERRNRKTGNVA